MENIFKCTLIFSLIEVLILVLLAVGFADWYFTIIIMQLNLFFYIVSIALSFASIAFSKQNKDS